MDGEAMMNTGEKIDYMIQCLKVAKAEYEYTADYVANMPSEQTGHPGLHCYYEKTG